MLSLATDTGRRSASHRFAPALNRFSLSGLRRGLIAVLLGLPLLAGLATEAAAQTTPTAPVANDDGTYTVPRDWALKPSAVNAGGRFRLLFTTSDLTTGVSTDIENYNGFVQTRASDFGHSAIEPYGSLFRALGSTAAVNARTNTMTTGPGIGIPTYWLGGAKVADNYRDLYDGSWDSLQSRNQLGTINQGRLVLTGTSNDGTTDSSPLGEGSSIDGIRQVRVGRVATSGSASPLSHATQSRIIPASLYALSPVFIVDESTTVSLTLDTATAVEGDSDFTDYTVTVSLSETRSTFFVFNLCVNSSGTATRDDDWDLRLTDGSRLTFTSCTILNLGGSSGTSLSRVIRVHGDTTIEFTETIVLELGKRDTTPDNVFISTTAGSVTHTIVNDDALASISLASSNAANDEGDSSTQDREFRINVNPARTSATHLLLCIDPGSTATFINSLAAGDIITASTEIDFSLRQPNGNLLSVVGRRLSQRVGHVVASVGAGFVDGVLVGGTRTRGCTIVMVPANQTSAAYRIRVNGDMINESDETVVLTLARQISANPATNTPNGVGISSTANRVTHTITNDDVMLVSLTRVGSGASSEVGEIVFQVILNRALVGGEIVDVPLSIGGTGVTPADWRDLSINIVSAQTGVTLTGEATSTPQLRFTGRNIGDFVNLTRFATLRLLPSPDSIAEGGGTGSETYTIALGPDGDVANGFDRSTLGTNVPLGANPHGSDNSFDVMVADADATNILSLSIDSAMGAESNSDDFTSVATITYSMTPARTSLTPFRVCVSGTADRASGDYRLLGFEDAVFTEFDEAGCIVLVFLPNATSFTGRLQINGDRVDEPDETVIVAMARAGSSSFGPTPSSIIADASTGRITYTITDDDPTIVSLTRAGTGAIGESGTVDFTIALNRALADGEIIDVPLSIGGTGVTTGDWSLAADGTGVTLSGEGTATPLLSFSGAGAETATLMLTATLDDTDEGGTETYTIALGPNDDSANGFDLASRATNVGGGADPHASDTTFDVMVVDVATPHIVSISLDRTMAAEGDSGITDGATVTVTFDPPYTGGFSFDICFGGTATRGDSADWRYTRTNNSPQTVSNITECESASDVVTNVASFQRKIRINGDTVDELDETVTLTLQRDSRTPLNFFISPTAGSATFTITDDDPTIVSLTRTGTGAIEEGGTVGFTIALNRALIAGEIIDVPLSIGGTGVTTGDWSLAADGTGVTLSGENTATPLLNFSGVGAETATLVLTTALDNTAEGGGTETYTIALGPNDDSANGFDLAGRGTNVGGGADPHASANTFDVMVGDVTTHTVSISLDRTMAAEGDSGITDGATVTITIDPPYPNAGLGFEICLSGTATRGDSADWRLTGALNIAADAATLARCLSGASPVITAPNVASFQSTIRISGDTVDEPDETVTLTLQRTSSTPADVVISPTANRVTYTITDDEPTIVSLTRTGGTGAIGEGGTVGFTIALNRALAAGEIIDVPLSIGGTGVTTDDWSLAAAGTGVTLSAEGTATPLLNFAGTGAETATLVLTPAGDNTDEGTETYTIALGPNDDSANGFDLASRATNVGGGADPHASDTTFDVMVTDTVVHTVSISLDRTMAAEGDSGITDGATVTITIDPPRSNAGFGFEICLSGTATPGDSADWRFTLADNSAISISTVPEALARCSSGSVGIVVLSPDVDSFQRKIRINGDTVDELDETVTLTLQRTPQTPADVVISPTANRVTYTITDDDPTIVSLTRTGTGAIEEGGTVGFTIELDRALTAGEIIDVPLSIGGTGVTTDDWSLAAAGTGVTLSAEATATPLLSFAGAGAETATLVLTTTLDDTAEGGGTETYTIALGPNDDSANGFDLASRATNVGGGADPHASDTTFDVMVTDTVVHTVSISLDRTMAAEGDSGITDGATVTITIDPPHPVGFSFGICLSGTATRGDSADWRFTHPNNTAPSIASDSSCSSGVVGVTVTTSSVASTQNKIRINGDTVDELNETVTLTLQRRSTTAPEVVISPTANRVTYTIIDDDTAGVIITETDDATTLTEDGTDDYGVMLATQPTANVTITATSGTTATATVNPTALTFTATNWDTVQTITVAGLDNNADAANQQVTITHAINSTGDAIYNALAPVLVTATVTDDDATTVTLAGAAGNVMEGAAKAITVTLSRALAEGEALPVPLTFMGEATPGTDYSVTGTAATGVAYTGLDSATGMVTFTGPSATSATLTLSATPDSDVEASGETVIIGLGTLDGDSGTGLDGGASGTDSLDDFSIEDPLLISITGGTAVTEGSSVTFTVTANRVPGSALMIDLTVADAAAGDYLDAGDEGDNMVTLSGATTATVEIPTQTDSTDETNGTITVTIADGTGYTVGMPSSAMVGVTDDDATTVTLTGTAGNISEGVTRNLTVTLDRALVAGESLAVPLTLGGNATRGTDYTLTGIPADNIAYDIPNSATAGMVTFTGPAAATATLALAVQVDGTSDTGETITIALGTLDSNSGSGLGGGAAGTGSLAFTIMEQPTIVLPPTLTVTEGASVGYPVSLATTPTANVTVTVTGHTGTDLTLNTDSLEFTAANWNMIQTFTVTAGQDADAVDDTATLTHTATGGNYNTLTAQITVNTSDDEEAGVTISETAITIAEGDEGTYTVVLDSQPASEVEITVTSGLTSAATVNPMILTFTMTNWDTAQTVTVTGVDDNRVNPVREATLSHRISSGGGDYPVADLNQDVTVTVTDNDEAGLSFSGETITVAEGATTNYTVALTTIPTGDVTVTVSGHSGTDLTPDETSLTFTMTDWDTAQTVTVTAAQDGDAANDTVTLTHTASGTTGYGAVMDDVTVIITDDDTAAITISETAGSTTVLENGSEAGGTDTYTVVLATQPASGVEITVTSGLTSAATVSPPILTFTMTNWDMEQTVTVTGVDDNINNPGDARTATLSHRISSGDSGDYPTGGPPTPAAVTVTVTDDDAAPGVTLSTARITVAEANGMDTYTVVLDTPPSGEVEITASSNLESAATVNPLILTFTTVNWDTEQMVTVTGINDDDTGDREATIGHAITTGDGGNYPVADLNQDVTVTVTDDDATDTQEMQAAQAAWLPRFGLTAVEHMLGGLDYRLSVADQPGLSGNVSGLSAGRALHGGGNATGTSYAADGFGQGGGGDGLGAGSVDRLLNLSRTLSLRDMLRGSRFVHRGGENGVSVWGQASYSRYEDGQDGVTVDGDVTTGMLGVDRDNGRTLLGLALSYSDGDGDWSGTSEQGELSSQLTSLLPYIRHNVTQRLQVWAAASYGRGELEQTLEQTSATMSTEHDIEQRSASAGVRGTLLERPLEEGGLTLTLISDAALARIESDDADGVLGLTSNTKRFRMGLEWSWQLPQADGGRLIPELELGLRYDGGDTSDGLGVELGGGISWQLPSRGLTIDLRGRRLLDHEAAERREWGVSGSLRYDRQPGSAHGPSLSLRQEYGTAPASGGLDRLLSDSLSDALEEDSSQPGPASGRWSLEGEWGLALSDGATGIPYAGLSSSDSGHDLTLGWRLLSAPGNLDTELDIKALRRRNDEGRANHGIGAQWKLRW